MELRPHQQRVVNEKNELDFKREALDEFMGGELFCTLSEDEQIRMIKQSNAMMEYSEILGERVKAFTADGA